MPQGCPCGAALSGSEIIGTVTPRGRQRAGEHGGHYAGRLATAEAARADAEVKRCAPRTNSSRRSLRAPHAAQCRTGGPISCSTATPGCHARPGARVIERNANAQARLIDDMLDMARIVTGKIRLELSVIDAVAATAAAIDVIRPTASAKRVSVQTDFGKGPKLIPADGARLQQVVWNVLANAVKFTPTGGRIDVRVVERDDAVQIVIRDTGRGITPEFLPFSF